MSSASRSRVHEVVAPVVAAAGYELDDLTVTRAGRRQLLRVVVDRDGGVDLDDVARISTSVSAALDAGDAMGAGPYVLEVSSPGVDRPLTDPRRWRRARGRLVRASLTAGGNVTGRVAEADDHGVVIEVDGRPQRVAYAELGPGHVQVEFRRGGEPGEEES